MTESLRANLQQAGVWYLGTMLLALIVSTATRGALPAPSPASWAVLGGGLVLAGLAAWLLSTGTRSPTADVEPEDTSSNALPPLTDTAKASVAVIPLENLSADDEDDVLARGISAEIIRALAGLPDLRVVSHLQSILYGHADMQRIQTELEVRYVLSGTVQRIGDQLRVNATLSDTTASSAVWSKTYDRRIDDLFAIQSEIAEAIAVETDSSYMIESSLESRAAEPSDLSAWGLTQKALNFWILSYNREGSEEALALLEQALTLEPDYAVAHAIKGFVLNQRFLNAFCDDPVAELAASVKAIEKAYAMAPRDPTVMEYAGLVFHNTGAQFRCVSVLRQLVEKSPYDLIAWGYLGNAYVFGGTEEQVEEGMEILERLPRIGPNHPSIPFWHYFLANGYARRGDWSAAQEHARIAVDAHPAFCMAWFALANAQSQLGEVEQARQSQENAHRANPNFSFQAFVDYMIQVCDQWTGYEAHYKGLEAANMIEVHNGVG